MSATRRLVSTDQNTSLWMDFCDDCGCAVSQTTKHVCFASAYEDVKTLDTNEYATESDWRSRPLTVAVTTRVGATYVIDGVENDTRVSLSGLDAVDKAALRVLLLQALSEVDPSPHRLAIGGVFTQPQTITLSNGRSVGE
jgi:hypothetical protein